MAHSFLCYLSRGLHRADSQLIKFFNPTLYLFMLAYILLAMHLPVSIYSLAGHDDALFYKGAINIISGSWLGNYNQMILAKGPGFSIFLAANAILGIPITLTLALLFCLAAWLLATRLHKLGLNASLTVIFFALILFSPQNFPTRIIRDNIYPALTLLIIAGIIDIFLLKAKSIGKFAFYGLCVAFFWMTREEGVWILPGIVFFLLLCFTGYLVSRDTAGAKQSLIALAKFLFFALVPVLIVCTINWIQYRAFVVVDFKEANFSRSLSLLNRIEPTQRTPHVPVNKEQREIAYRISPSFAKLKPYFEREGLNWTRPGCNVYKETCGDFAGGWFMWAYRDAVAHIGKYDTYKNASAFYKAIGDEIGAACDKKLINCKPKLLGFLPHLDSRALKDIPKALLDSYKLLTYQTGVHPTGGPSMDANNVLYPLRIFLGNPLSMPSDSESATIFRGWYYSKTDINNWVFLECQNSKKTIARQDSPDIAAAMKDAEANKQRFHFEVDPKDKCTVQLDSGQNLSLNSLTKQGSGAVLNDDNHVFFIDQTRTLFPEKILTLTKLIKEKLANIYQVVVSGLLIFALIALAGCIIYSLKRRPPFEPLFMVALFAWALLATRVVILILIDISSFPAINGLYMGPGFALTILACVASIAALSKLFNSPKEN